MGEGSDAGQGEPGFGDMAGSDALPDMRDTLPTFDESYGEAGDTGEADGEAEETAMYFLKNDKTWESWVSADVAKKVKAAL